MKHLNEQELVLFHYGEARDRAAVESHLAACASCRSELEGLRRVLAAVEAGPLPERGAAYGAEVFARLLPRLEEMEPAGFSWRALMAPRRWALAVALAGLLVAAFLAGRFWPRPQAPAAVSQSGTPERVRERILLVAVGDHLERSQMVLLELVNTRPGQAVDISAEQQQAEELLAENRLYRQTAASAGQTGMAALLEELERLLLEIAHSPEKLHPAELDQIRRRIEAQGILFKVRVFGSELRERQNVPAQPPSRGSL